MAHLIGKISKSQGNFVKEGVESIQIVSTKQLKRVKSLRLKQSKEMKFLIKRIEIEEFGLKKSNQDTLDCQKFTTIWKFHFNSKRINTFTIPEEPEDG